MTDRDLIAAEPMLPGIAPDIEIGRLLASFSTFDEGGVVIINRMPTAIEREVLQKRSQVLATVLAPVEGSRPAWSDLKQRLAQFFMRYPSLLQADAPGLITAYIADLQSQPLFAIIRALDDIRQNKVLVRDKRGNEVPLDKDWPPSSARIYDVTVKVGRERFSEKSVIDRILRAKRLARPELSEEERRAGAAKIMAMNDEFQRTVAIGDSSDRAVRDDLQRRRADRVAAEQAARDEAMRAEYERLCVEPVFMGGVIVSPELALKMQPGLFSEERTDENIHRRAGDS